MKKANLLYLLVFGLILCSFKCTDDEEEFVDQRVVGTWYGKSSYNNPVTGVNYRYLMVTFNNDNTGILEYESPLGLGVGSFVWTTSKNQVSCYDGGYVDYEGVASAFSMKLRIEGDRLIPEDRFTSFILTRDGSVETDVDGNEIVDNSALLQNVWVETGGKSVMWFKDAMNVVEYRFEDTSNPDIYSFRRNTQYSYSARDNEIKIEDDVYSIVGVNGKELTLRMTTSPYSMHMYDIGTKQDIPSDVATTYDAGYAVDLGLPSGIKWANCNVGASSPEGFGGYYAWGETFEKESYAKTDYTYYKSSKQEWVDIGTNISGTRYDVACQRWGGDWRMPTKEEIEELIDECSWQWTSINKVNGYRITGPNGNSIFIPAAGYRVDNGLYRRGYQAISWSDKVVFAGAHCLRFGDAKWERSIIDRYVGVSVRPVCGVFKSKTVTVTTGGATDITSNSAVLSGTLSDADKSITCGIIYGTSSSLSSTSGTKVSSTSSGDYSVTVTDLEDNTTYYYRAYAISDGEYCYGEVCSFKTENLVVIEAIDLGLSVKWASCNVGAESPEDYGGYYAWGETKEKNDYSSSTSITYGLSTSELRSQGIIDSDDNLTAAYDAATDNWGSSWRMPTKEEIEELFNKCSWEWTSVNGVSGRKVTGPNGNSIFLPAAGYRYRTGVLSRGSGGHYWSGTLYEDDSSSAYGFCFYSGGRGWNDYGRNFGLTVRPVTE